MMTLDPLPDPGTDPINTLANSWLEWGCGRNIVGLKMPWFIGIPSAEYVRSVFNVGHELEPAKLRSAHEAGQLCLTLEIAAQMALPVKASLEAQLPARLPTALRTDAVADCRQWPSRLKPRGGGVTDQANPPFNDQVEH